MIFSNLIDVDTGKIMVYEGEADTEVPKRAEEAANIFIKLFNNDGASY